MNVPSSDPARPVEKAYPGASGPTSPKRSPAVPALIAIAVIMAVGLFLKSRSAGKGAAPEGAGQTRTQVRTVRVDRVTLGTVIQRLAITGQLRSNQNVDLNSKISGRVARVLVNEGQRVTRGQLLVVLDEQDLRSQVQNARANLQSALVKLQQTQANQPSRVGALQTAVNQAKAQLGNAQAATQAARARYRQSQLTEPVQNKTLNSQVQNTLAGVRQAQAQLKQARETAQQTREQVNASISQAQSALKQAQAQLEQTRNGARAQEILSAEAQVRLAEAQVSQVKAQVDDAQTNLNRQNTLFQGGATAKANVDAAQTQLEVQNANLKVQNANLENARQQLSLVRAGSRTEEVRAAEEVVQQREAALLSARAQQNSVLAAQSQVAQAIAGVAQSQEALRTAQANLGQIGINQQATRTALEAVRQSEAQERQARATLQGAQSDLSQIPGIRADVPAAQAAVDSARSQLEQQELNLSYARIVSPVNGVVNTKSIDVGEYASPGTALMNLVALDSVYFEAQVPESQLADIKVGQAAYVTVTAVSNKPVIGYVSEIIPVADQQLRQFRLRITLPESAKMTPGAFARGLLETASAQNRPTVPTEDVRTENGDSYLLLAQGDGDTATVKKVNFTPGIAAGGRTEIAKGEVEIGDKVIIGTANFDDGDKVRVERESGSQSGGASSGSSGEGSSASSSASSSSTSSSSTEGAGASSGGSGTGSGSSGGSASGG